MANNFCGRKVLKTNYEYIDRSNVVEVLTDLLGTFNQNSRDIDYLYKYYCGRQPVLDRIKTFRDDIVNYVLENHAEEIVSFKKGYVFGEPVQYVRRTSLSMSDDRGIDEGIAILNEIMACEDMPNKDEELAEWMLVCGTGYKKTLPKKRRDGSISMIDTDICDPRQTSVVYYSGFGRRPLMSIEKVVTKDANGNDLINYCIYTDREYFIIRDSEIVEQVPHAMGHIPVVEYPANNARKGAFESVIYILDAINILSSNRVDDIEQTVQAFMKFVNVKIDETTFEEFKRKGVLMFTSDPGCPADVSIVTNGMSQQQPQVLKDDLLQQVYTICGMPDRNGQNRTSGDTGSAVVLRDGWAAAETKAKEIETMFERSERVFIRDVIEIAGNALTVKAYDIDIKFRPNRTDNLLVKTQGLQNMLEAHIHPSIAIATCGLFSDPERVYADSEEFIKQNFDKIEAENLKAKAESLAKLIGECGLDPKDAIEAVGMFDNPDAVASNAQAYAEEQEQKQLDNMARINNVSDYGQDDSESEPTAD